jgi:oligopeptide/dipeptide ABC transporter ATP-binding protein
VTALALMGLLPSPPARIPQGRALFEGADLLHLPPRAMRRLRGDRLAMIFQEPMTSLNPALTVGEQIGEVLREHLGLSPRAAQERAVQLLARVRIPNPAACAQDYPHRLSGGMRQRVMIAIALACAPAVLIADEPTTALDVTVQAEILDLLRELQADTGMALLLITHDLGVVGEMADEVAVMYAGRIVEQCAVHTLFERPEHPYTIGLLGALPSAPGSSERLTAIEGTVPPGTALPPGCRFHPRCPFAVARCRQEVPPLIELAPGHAAACWRAPLDGAAA